MGNGKMVIVRYWFVYVFTVIFVGPGCGSISIEGDRNQALKQEVYDGLTTTEKRLIFADEQNPDFRLVYPQWTRIDGENGFQKNLQILNKDISLNVTLDPSNQFITHHITGSNISDFHAQENCHWRFVNKTFIVTVNECFTNGIHALIISNWHHGIIYPANMQHTSPNDKHLHPHILYEINRSIIDTLIEKSNRLIPREYKAKTLYRRKRDVQPLAKFKTSDPLLDYDYPVDELTNFPEINIDLESDLERFRVASERKFEIESMDSSEDDQSEFLEIKLRKTVELAIFCDSFLVEIFERNQDGPSQITLQQYIQIMVNALEGIYHQEELGGYIIDFKLVRLEMFKPSEGPESAGGNIGNYLNNFSAWQKNRNPGTDSHPGHWDNAVLLSGLDLHSGGNRGVLGLAWVGGMCSSQFSSNINEGGSFLALYVLAHEIGHNFGMDHDGTQSAPNCNSNNHIMSPSVGPGRTTWSSCSIQIIQQFLRRSTCLEENSSSFPTFPPNIDKIKMNLPGQIFPPRLQCQLAHGQNYRPVIRPGNDICSYLFCTDSGGRTRGAHPALQGSNCAPRKICIAGSCKDESELKRLIVLFREVFKKVDQKDLRQVTEAKEDKTIRGFTDHLESRDALESFPHSSLGEQKSGASKLRSDPFPLAKHEKASIHRPQLVNLRTTIGPCSVSCGLGRRTLYFQCVSDTSATQLPLSECGFMNGVISAFEECRMPVCGQSE